MMTKDFNTRQLLGKTVEFIVCTNVKVILYEPQI